jgi:hypothetical protein
MFRFLPNPDPQEPKDPEKSWFADLAPWSVGLNMSFIRNSFKQSISFDEKVSFQGIYTLRVTSSVNLGLICGPQTKDMFYDVTLAENGCITPKKAEDLQKRIGKEVVAKEAKLTEYEGPADRRQDHAGGLRPARRDPQHAHADRVRPRATRAAPRDVVREVEEQALAHVAGRTHAPSDNGALRGDWHAMEVGEQIGDGPGMTKTVEFRNLTNAKGGRYGLKIGSAAQENWELGPHERRTHQINRQPWNAVNNGKIEIDYRRDNSAAMVEERELAGAGAS